MLIPLRYKVVLSDGCVVRSNVEVSSPMIRLIPFDEFVDVCEKRWTDHPAGCCIPRLKLLDGSGWISLRLNRLPPEDYAIVELVGPSPAKLVAMTQSIKSENNGVDADSSDRENVTLAMSVSNIVEERRDTLAERHDKERFLCVICMDNPRTAILVHEETGHIACCLKCARLLKARGDLCPVCRLPISSVVQYFWA